jgi:hypothetical protein
VQLKDKFAAAKAPLPGTKRFYGRDGLMLLKLIAICI